MSPRLSRSVGAGIAFLVILSLASLWGSQSPEQGIDPDRGPGSVVKPTAPKPEPTPPSTRRRDRGVFDGKRLLVAYYGTAGTGSLGVLGEDPPDVMDRRLRRAARPFARSDQRIQPVYELIVTVADPHPGADGDYNHHLARRQVEEYLRAARRHRALVLLDLQPGSDGFLDVAKHWEWALRDPAVGLALDPE